MNNQFFCKNLNRLNIIRENHTLNGIDYLEISSEDQTTLKIYFVFNLPGEPGGVPDVPPNSAQGSSPGFTKLTKENIFIEGGVRIKNIRLKNDITVKNNVLTVSVDKAGDFSNYVLKIGSSSTDKDTPPAGFDIVLSSVEFSFKINCPTEFDCKTEVICPNDDIEEPNIDYLAKDYSSFKRLMLDRLSTITPDWKERNAADLQITLIELLAYIGDHLSYYQDAVSTEAYIGKARRRISLKRHARLLDYFVHDGCNARVWVHIEIERHENPDKDIIEKGTVLLTNADAAKVVVKEDEKMRLIIEDTTEVFETMHEIKLHHEHNRISFYTWGDSDCCLPKGSTSATLLIETGLYLTEGDVLIFEELYSPTTGKKADADPKHRLALRLKKTEILKDKLTGASIMNIEWYEKDALPFALCLTSSQANKYKDGDENSTLPINEKSVARGNIVLADHGMTQKSNKLSTSAVANAEKFYPKLPEKNITCSVSYDHHIEKLNAASLTLKQDPRQALPFVILVNEIEVWEAKKDLLDSDRSTPEFVVETEQDGTSFLRFGDGILGKKPAEISDLHLTYRIGNGKGGNVGAEMINTIEWNHGGISKVRNPMAAKGGTNAESMEEVRLFAPQAFRIQERAVLESDYIQKTELHPEVQKAVAKFYWTGSWYTVYIIIDRKGGKEVDEAFKKEIKHHLEHYRMAGFDLEIRQPRFVPLDISLNICVKPGYFKSYLKQELLRLFSNYAFADGTKGFFHPDNFTFGTPVYLSSIYSKAMSVQGVESAQIKQFKRRAHAQGTEIDDGLLKVSELEIVRLDNDHNFPENGKIDFIMFGGL